MPDRIPTLPTSRLRCIASRSWPAALAALALVPGLAAASMLASGPAIAASRIRVTITGASHHPIVNKKWTYSVTVTAAGGQKLSGTETTEYLYNGSVVGTEKPENVRFKNGSYHDSVLFPAEAVGQPLVVEAVVHTKDGTGKAGWTISVKK